jgi:uncharacterized membrane protein
VKKFRLACAILVLVTLTFFTLPVFTAPVRSDKLVVSGYFTFVKAYWGIDQQIEVSPGDVATLTVVLMYESTYSISNIEANLSLPNGFESVGGGDKAITFYTGAISTGSLVKLEFPIFITRDLEKGNYTADLNLEFYVTRISFFCLDELEVIFEVMGKPNINVNVLNENLYEGKQQISLSLSNDGDAVAKNFVISKVYSSSTSAEFEAKLDNAKFLNDLKPGDNITVPLQIDVPTGTKGKILPLTVEVSYLGPSNVAYAFSESQQLPVTAVEEVKVTTTFPDVTIEAGKVVQYPITITNSGDTEKLLLLSVEPPTDWTVVFKSGTLEISRIYMAAGESENLVIEATPPSAANISTYQIPVQIKSENGDIYAEMNLKATIVGSYALGLETSTLLTSITAGGTTSFTAKVTNTGQSSVTGVSLNVEVPTNWDSSISPTKVDVLGPSESYTFSVVITAPGDTVTGDYMVTLKGLSDQVQSDQVQVRNTVTTSTEWGLYGIGVAAIFIVALVLVFMKFRRR